MVLDVIKTPVLIAEEGYYLTQASEEIELTQRTFGKKVYLSANSKESDWKEIPEAEAESLKAEKQKLIFEQREKEKAERLKALKAKAVK